MTDIERWLTNTTAMKATLPVPAGTIYRGMDDFILRHGRLYTPQELTPAERKIVTAAARRTKPFKIKECFYNAQKMLRADETDTLVYVEGYATSIIPIHHGWLTINDKVIDFTMRERVDGKTVERRPYGAGIFGAWKADREYFGVPIPKERMLAFTADGMGASIIDDWQNGWPLLRRSGSSRD
jgi:hypothetical protein